ncbi:threonine ammonia-lyase [Isachenkonia alkalipeptolytica]|uniref:threonine ammonia-lyase n=1 Tax=Isachenkonia alkalipeptolytica TaxID=2565777 RepID=A0AA44BCH2_9CLOT|nr:threonine/serine dehydratase [Isachenkonia alkalipeptolytica]NBG87359.1 threonine/serine dehydratase [Isachenkonia alkalipeptolytica]
MKETGIPLDQLEKARERLKNRGKITPLLRGETLDHRVGAQVYVKPENLQVTGSFKIRGATNKMLTLGKEALEKGVIAASSGNHALGVSYAAKMLNTKAVIVMPTNAPKIKREKAKALGAEVILHGTTSRERYDKVEELIRAHGYTLIHSYADEDLMAGQGTVGLEILEALPEVDRVVVPLGGGGLLSGVVSAIKGTNPNIQVVGVETEAVPRYTVSLENRRPTTVEIQDTFADGLRVVEPGKRNFEIIQALVDQVITVGESDLRQATKALYMETKLVVEPSAAVGIAAALGGKLQLKKKEKVCFLLSGGNVDEETMIEILKGGSYEGN